MVCLNKIIKLMNTWVIYNTQDTWCVGAHISLIAVCGLIVKANKEERATISYIIYIIYIHTSELHAISIPFFFSFVNSNLFTVAILMS